MTKKNQKASGGGKKNSLAIILMLLIAVGACALAGYTFYEMKNIKANVASGDKKEAVVKEPELVVPLYIPLETFTVSLAPATDGSDRVLYIGLTLRVADAHSKMLVEKFLPEIRSRIFVLLAHQSAEELATDEGKRQLIEKIKHTLGEPLAPKQSVKINDVLFNAFILR